MKKRVLIANKCGLFSALPTLDEFNRLAFDLNNMIYCLVYAEDEDVMKVFNESSRIRVLLPGLPKPLQTPGYLYVSVVMGQLILIEPEKPSINVQKKPEKTNRFRAFWVLFRKYF